MCDSEFLLGSNDVLEYVFGFFEIDSRFFEKVDFLEWECCLDSVWGRFKINILVWKELEFIEVVLSVIKEGYKLLLYSILEFCVLWNNKFVLDNNDFVMEVLNDFLVI